MPLLGRPRPPINAEIIDTGQSVYVTIYCRSDPDSLIDFHLPDEMVMDIVNGCHDSRRHFSLMGNSISRVGLQICADGRNAVWTESDAAGRSAESPEPRGLSSPPIEGN